MQEAKAASSLSHPNIVVVHDIGQAVPVEEGSPPAPDAAPVHYMAMELVEGATLRQLFADRSIEPRTLLAHLAQTAEGLAKAHAAGSELLLRDPRASPVAFSPSGDRLAYFSSRREAQGLVHPVLRVIPAAGGEVLAELDRGGMQSAPRWSPDGRSLVARVQRGDASALLSFPLDGGPPSLLTDLTGLEVRDFVLDADGEWITYVRVDTSSDAVLIESFQ